MASHYQIRGQDEVVVEEVGDVGGLDEVSIPHRREASEFEPVKGRLVTAGEGNVEI